MKTTLFTLLFVVAVASANAQPVTDLPSQSSLTQIGTKSFLRGPTALVNKNNVIADNNIAITKSNLFFTADDRVALASKLEAMVTKVTDQEAETGVLSRNILKAVSGGDADAVMMDKTSAVVAAKGHPTQLTERINELLDSTMPARQQPAHEAAKATTLIGTSDILRQPSSVVNKNAVLSGDNVALQHDRVALSQNDQITLSGDARVANTIASGSVVRADQLEGLFSRKRKSNKKKTSGR